MTVLQLHVGTDVVDRVRPVLESPIALFGSIFPSRLRWNWSPSSVCHTLTILQFSTFWPSCFLFITFRTVLLASSWKKHKTNHITPLFQKLHWLPIPQRIQYKVNTLCYKCSMRTAPSYLCDCLQLYTHSCTLCSSSDTLSLQILHTRLHTVGSCTFSVIIPVRGMTFPFLTSRNPL